MNKKNGADRFRKSIEAAGSSTAKFSDDIFNGKEKNSDFYTLDCSKIKEFSLKEEFDFTKWNPDKFEALKESIEQVGVLHPIIVRCVEDKKYPYEILAGEHRWKASVELGRNTIPAKIIHPCDDIKAKTVFTLTNILSRDLTIIDKIHGWSHYFELTHGHTQEEIFELKEEGVLDEHINEENYSKKQIKRYHQASKLEPAFLDFISEGILGITIASYFAALPQESRTLILNHKDRITTKRHFKRIYDLCQDKISNYSFDEEGIAFVLSGETVTPREELAKTFTEAAVISKKALKNVLKETDYHRAAQVTESGIGLYYQLQEHPELLVKLYHSISGEVPTEGQEIEELSCEAIEKVLDSSILIKALEAYLK